MADFQIDFTAVPNTSVNCTKLLFTDTSNYGQGNNVTKASIDKWVAQIYKFNPFTYTYDLVQEVSSTTQKDTCEFDINPVIGASLMVSFFARCIPQQIYQNSGKTITLTCLLNL